MDTIPSAVSVMREKTVSYFKCHTRGFEKVIWPIFCIAALLVSVVLLAVACGTQNWFQLDVSDNRAQQRGNITFGLLRGSHRVHYNISDIVNTINNGSYYLYEKMSLGYLARIHATFAFSMLSIIISLLNIGISLLNSYQSITSWWKGPTMMYLLSLISGVCGLTAVGVFLDHFLWDLDTPSIFVNVTQLNKGEALIIDNMTVDSFEYLLTTRGYRSAPSLLYSFYLEVAGACIPLFVTLLAWRLALLISPRKRPLEDRVLAQEEMVYPLKPTSNLQHLAAGNPKVTTRDMSFGPEDDAGGDSSGSSITATPPPQPRKGIKVSKGEVLY